MNKAESGGEEVLQGTKMGERWRKRTGAGEGVEEVVRGRRRSKD